jgi:exodeoxyribonuclease V gamma subunit
VVQAPMADEEPFVLDALQRYGLSESLLTAALSGSEEIESVLQGHALKLQGSGLLPMAGFGVSLQEELIEPLPNVLRRYRELLSLWPEPLSSALPVSFSHNAVELDGWLGGLHRNGKGELLIVNVIPNGIGSKKTRKWHRLIRPWVTHLVACACGLPLSTALVASDETLLLAICSPLGNAACASHYRSPSRPLSPGWLSRRTKLKPRPERGMKATVRPPMASAGKARP